MAPRIAWAENSGGNVGHRASAGTGEDIAYRESVRRTASNSTRRTSMKTRGTNSSSSSEAAGLIDTAQSSASVGVFPPSFKVLFVKWNAALCSSWRFSLLTTVLTIYALFGDDFRLAATHKDFDGIFNIITLVCIVVFAIEVVAASIGRPEYFLGFFFYLDFVSTVTLVLDLTWIANAMLCGGGGAQDEAVKTSRAGRAGARASRTVRIIRLLRLVKLYKTYRAAMEQKAEQKKLRNVDADTGSDAGEEEEGKVKPGEEVTEPPVTLEDSSEAKRESETESEVFDEGKNEEDEEENTSETRVGKKLSEMTTRRVIVLVLIMLFFLPQFSPENTQFTHRATHSMADFQSSSHLGMSFVYERWRQWCPANTSTSTLPHCLQPGSSVSYTQEQQTLRWWYEEYLLNFIYTHHSGAFFNRLCWIGFASSALENYLRPNHYGSVLNAKMSGELSELAQLGQAKYLGEMAVPKELWDQHYIDAGWKQPLVQPLTTKIKDKLTQPWVEECQGYYGVPVSELISARRPTGCSIDNDLRCSEVEYYFPESRTSYEEEQISLMFAFDRRQATQTEARLSVLQTIFICAAVGIGTVLFANDADHLLLSPIQRMIAKMETIKDNPLEAMRLGDLEYRREELEIARRKEELANKGPLSRFVALVSARKASQPMETMILEKTIIKLGGFLILSFGEAGAEIVRRHIRGNHTVELDALVPGQLVNSVICFCGIRKFGDLLDGLKEQITVFVNLVGEVVHAVADEHGGAPSKNYGDCFLLTWRLDGNAQPNQRRRVADMAVLSMIRIVQLIAKSGPLSEYVRHPALQRRIPNFRPQVGFGMHCGACAECAVGSEFKLDPMYLSPNVKIASQLQNASALYGVHLLLSHFMMTAISHELALYCRLIDHVSLQGTRLPLRIFTIDLDPSPLKDENSEYFCKHIKNRFKVRQFREMAKHQRWAEEYKVTKELDEDFLEMRDLFTYEFFLRFYTGYQNYEAGAWLAAKDLFVTCHYKPDRTADSFVAIEEERWPIDGPTTALLSFMKRSDFVPPNGWPGYRRLILESGH